MRAEGNNAGKACAATTLWVRSGAGMNTAAAFPAALKARFQKISGSARSNPGAIQTRNAQPNSSLARWSSNNGLMAGA